MTSQEAKRPNKVRTSENQNSEGQSMEVDESQKKSTSPEEPTEGAAFWNWFYTNVVKSGGINAIQIQIDLVKQKSSSRNAPKKNRLTLDHYPEPAKVVNTFLQGIVMLGEKFTPRIHPNEWVRMLQRLGIFSREPRCLFTEEAKGLTDISEILQSSRFCTLESVPQVIVKGLQEFWTLCRDNEKKLTNGPFPYQCVLDVIEDNWPNSVQFDSKCRRVSARNERKSKVPAEDPGLKSILTNPEAEAKLAAEAEANRGQQTLENVNGTIRVKQSAKSVAFASKIRLVDDEDFEDKDVRVKDEHVNANNASGDFEYPEVGIDELA